MITHDEWLKDYYRCYGRGRSYVKYQGEFINATQLFRYGISAREYYRTKVDCKCNNCDNQVDIIDLNMGRRDLCSICGKDNHRNAMIKLWQDPEFIHTMTVGQSDKWKDDEFRKTRSIVNSESNIKRWSNKNNIKKYRLSMVDYLEGMTNIYIIKIGDYYKIGIGSEKRIALQKEQLGAILVFSYYLPSKLAGVLEANIIGEYCGIHHDLPPELVDKLNISGGKTEIFNAIHIFDVLTDIELFIEGDVEHESVVC